MTTLIHHAASLEEGLPPGSLAALRACLQSNAAWIEVDIVPLKGGDFALVHDPLLDHISDGKGAVFEKNAEEIRKLVYKPTPQYAGGEFLGTLSRAIHFLKIQEGKSKLQLDLKPYCPLSMEVLSNLVELIKPVKERILVSSVADWSIRMLHRIDESLFLGFDPLLYLDVPAKTPRPEGVPPFRAGAYGYLDEHPLAVQRWGSLQQYFAMRAESLYQLAPAGATWFLNAELLNDALNAGFNWIEYLHENGSLVDAWTVDMDRSELAARLVTAGVDYLTSNQADNMAAFLGPEIIL
jgi:glycerophosphoryl diester phosphodiesterase